MYTNMSANSSSLDHLPLRAPPLPSNSTSHLAMRKCFRSKMSVSFFSSISFTYILLLPLLLLVIYLGYQQWRKQGSLLMAATSHSDMFTYHSIAMQLSEFFGFIVFFCAGYIGFQYLRLLAVYFLTVNSLGQGMLHLLACVERYLAVVHPVTYLGLRQRGGARIRNVSIACVWLLCFLCGAMTHKLNSESNLIFFCSVIVFFLGVLSFCSIFVLCALVRPRPGKVGGKGELVDQSKKRAFRIILAVMGVLALRFGGNLVYVVTHNLAVTSEVCVVLMSTLWFSLPSNLMSSLLFLHRAGKLQRCQRSPESG